MGKKYNMKKATVKEYNIKKVQHEVSANMKSLQNEIEQIATRTEFNTIKVQYEHCVINMNRYALALLSVSTNNLFDKTHI